MAELIISDANQGNNITIYADRGEVQILSRETCNGQTVFDFCDNLYFTDGSDNGEDYVSNLDCEWLITPPTGTPRIEFDYFDLEVSSGSTIYDYLSIYDGVNASAPLIGTYHGGALPPASIVGLSGSLFLQFHTDGSVENNGWAINYYCDETSICNDAIPIGCGETWFDSNIGQDNDFDFEDYSCLNGNGTYSGNDVIYQLNHNGGALSVTLFSRGGINHDLFLAEDCFGDTGPLAKGINKNCIAASTNLPSLGGLNLENIYFDYTAPGTYYLVVDGRNAADIGPYDLTISCIKEHCFEVNPPPILECGEWVYNETNNMIAAPGVTNYCGAEGTGSGVGCTGPERLYLFEVLESGTYTITLENLSSTADLELFVIDGYELGAKRPFDCLESSICYGSSTNPRGADELIQLDLSAGDYAIVVDGWEGDVGNYNIRLDCPSPCNDYTLSYNCGYLDHYQWADGSYRFLTSDPNAEVLGEWLVDGVAVDASSHRSLRLQLDPGQTYEICYPYLDQNACLQYCCERYCIEDDFDPPILYEYTNGGNTLNLSLDVSGATNIEWYVDLGSDGPGVIGQGTNLSRPVNGFCGAITYWVRFFRNGCWQTYSRTIYLCNPFECAAIDYGYDRQNERWDLSFSAGNASSIVWIDDDNNGVVLASGTSFLSIDPRPSGACGLRNISVRYFDGSSWRVCCLRFWDCDPYNCGNLITFDNVPGEAVDVSLVFSDASQFTWLDDATNQPLPGSAGQSVVSLPWPTAGCQTRYISVRYFDATLGVFRICCIVVNVCRPVACNPPSFTNCNDQDYYLQADSGYRITTTRSSFASDEEWYINDQPISQISYSISDLGDQLVCYFPSPGSYEVCYPYFDNQGCLQYCCQEYCVDETPEAVPMDLRFDATEEEYVLSLAVPGASAAQWYYLTGGEQIDFDSGLTARVPISTNCYTRIFYCRYRDAAGCWRVAYREVLICDTNTCGTISYRFSPGENAFVLQLEATNADAITWFDDDNGIVLPGNASSITVVLEEECGPRNFSVRYFDGNVWRICCLRYDACNPFACNQILPVYDATQNQYVLTLANANGLEQFSWADDDDPTVNFLANGPILDIPVIGGCRQRNISVRYYDPVNRIWGFCCVSYWQCRPEECSEVINDRILGEDRVELSILGTFSTIDWMIDGAGAGAGNSIEAVIPVGQTRRVCVRYFDTSVGYWRTCCRDVLNPDCELPVPQFLSALSSPDSVRLENINVQAGETYSWEVDGASLSTSLPQLTLHLPPGQHQICLRAINACGVRTVCGTIFVPNPVLDPIFDLENGVCGQAGEVIDLPLRVRNFRDMDAFQFTVSLPSPRGGKFLGADYELASGTLNQRLVNDSTLALIWIQTESNGTTLPDSTILCNLRIELLSAVRGDGIVNFTNLPTSSGYARVNGVFRTPGLLAGGYRTCSSDASLSGIILREAGQGIGRVDVGLWQNGTLLQSVTTDLNGTYEFTGLTSGLDYTIRPVKDINHRNGVNAGDMSSIRRHIFGVQPLTSPYQHIAANVVNFADIEASDISQLRRLIFQQIPRYEAVDSWHFVPESYQFPNPERPLTPAYPTEITVSAGRGSTADLNFIGVKMGDIDQGALRGQLLGSNERPKQATDLKFMAVSEAPRAGMKYQVDILVEDFTEMAAAQFSLGWNPEIL
ncbi:MAG: CUB domain-containing protein, partial [Bacteroidota bacterium]